MAPVLSIVIPVLNGADTIHEQLAAINDARGSTAVEVIVSDNGSTDGTREIALSWLARGLDIRIVDSADRRGISHARNVGVQEAKSELVAICDADDRVGPDWVDAMVSGLQEHAVVTGPLLVSDINPPEVSASRGTRTEREPATFVGLFRYPHGCNQGFRVSAWRDVDGFDEALDGIISEDIDFGMRLHLHGIDIGFVPDAAVRYRYRRGAAALFRQGLAYGTGRAHLARSARDAGFAVPRLAGLRSWGWMILHLPEVARPSRREAWMWVAGNRIGQLRGSIRSRIVFL